MIDFSVLTDNIDTYLEGFLYTLRASVTALICSFILGALLAIFRIAPIKALNWIGTAYVEFFRNIPLLIIVFFIYIGLPTVGIELNGFISGTIGLTIYTSAFIAEAIRAGIMAVPKGQMEAARSSGLSYNQAMRMIILPQAIKIVIPSLGNQFLNLVKNSSILTVVAGLDLMYAGDMIAASTFKTIDTYIFVGMFYLILTIPLNYMVIYLENRFARKGV
ncbi:amino acid ABC transporter permease [Bacillus testis]|uniref:amino acid ABC transporter permease n=1 Tax=Bacillus testis TaxID=1622072 RepID=UPI00067F4FF9|nr:amino acid ABC transporter permease [Bacillus testis]